MLKLMVVNIDFVIIVYMNGLKLTTIVLFVKNNLKKSINTIYFNLKINKKLKHPND